MESNTEQLKLDEILSSITDKSTEDALPEKLKDLIVVIEGDHVSGSIDYLVAQSIVSLQQIVYRIVAHALYGEGASVKNLTEIDLERFKLNFKVESGCTHVSARLIEKFSELLNVIFKNMTPAHKLILASILSAAFLGYIAIDRVEDYFKEADRNNTIESLSSVLKVLSQEETKRAEAILSNVKAGGEEASANFAKSAKGASSLTFGGRTYSQSDLTDIQKRTPRIPADWEVSNKAYVVQSLDKQKEDVVWAVIRDIETGESFKASYTVDEEEEDTRELLTRMAQSLLDGSAVVLTVNKATKKGENKVVKASILGFIDEEQ